MHSSDFIKVCRAVEHGQDVYLENVVDRKKGRVLFCTSRAFHVDIDGKRDSWLPQVCVKS